MEREKKRRWFQAASALGINIYLPAWLEGRIFRGAIKGTCVPVLNCYSCPSAVGACPIGALQNSMASLRFNISAAQFQFGLYVIGFLGLVGEPGRPNPLRMALSLRSSSRNSSTNSLPKNSASPGS